MFNSLYSLLSNKNYYSLTLQFVSHQLNISLPILRLLGTNSILSQKFISQYNDHINIFTFNNVEYIGLESRRLDYERDKANGTNWVEDAIKAGYYD